MWHEKSIGKMSVSSKVCRIAYDEYGVSKLHQLVREKNQAEFTGLILQLCNLCKKNFFNVDATKLAAYAEQLLPRSDAAMYCILRRGLVWMHLNIPLIRRQNTDIAWNWILLRADIMLLRTDVTLLPVHTCT